MDFETNEDGTLPIKWIDGNCDVIGGVCLEILRQEILTFVHIYKKRTESFKGSNEDVSNFQKIAKKIRFLSECLMEISETPQGERHKFELSVKSDMIKTVDEIYSLFNLPYEPLDSTEFYS